LADGSTVNSESRLLSTAYEVSKPLPHRGFRWGILLKLAFAPSHHMVKQLGIVGQPIE
jgi:hypothetical protein